MNLPQLVTDYGYVALAVGCLLEGETVLVMAGYAAHRGLLSWPMVFAVAAIFSFAGDQMWFQVGRHYGQRLIERFTLLRERLPEHPGYFGEMVWILMMLEQWLRAKAPAYRLS